MRQRAFYFLLLRTLAPNLQHSFSPTVAVVISVFLRDVLPALTSKSYTEIQILGNYKNFLLTSFINSLCPLLQTQHSDHVPVPVPVSILLAARGRGRHQLGAGGPAPLLPRLADAAPHPLGPAARRSRQRHGLRDRPVLASQLRNTGVGRVQPEDSQNWGQSNSTKVVLKLFELEKKSTSISFMIFSYLVLFCFVQGSRRHPGGPQSAPGDGGRQLAG